MSDLDLSELDAFEADLRAAAARVMPKVEGVIKKGALNIKKTMQQDATGHRRLRGLPSTVNYDIESDALSIEAVIGFRKVGQGNLANVAAFGTSNNAPVMDITRGLRDEEKPVIDWLLKVGVAVIA